MKPTQMLGGGEIGTETEVVPQTGKLRHKTDICRQTKDYNKRQPTNSDRQQQSSCLSVHPQNHS